MKKIICALLSLLLLCGCSAQTEKGGETIETVSHSEYDSIDNTASGWGLVRRKGTEPEVTAKQKETLQKYGAYYMDTSKPKALYLTFDEGYENGYTSKILDVLEATKTPAAFFVTGPYLESQTELVKRMVEDGHIIGNHTVNHINMPKSSVETIEKDITGLSEMCEEMYGVKMKYVRPPEGEYSERTLAIMRDMGYTPVFWSFAYKDWDVNLQKGADYAFSQVTPYLHDGAILLLHAVSSDNANALEDIINYAREKGYEFRSLDELQ